MDMPGSVMSWRARGCIASLRELDALVHVVRAFEDEASSDGSGFRRSKPRIENVELELDLSTSSWWKKRLERLEKDIKKQKNPALGEGISGPESLQGCLEKQTPLRQLDMGAEESR